MRIFALLLFIVFLGCRVGVDGDKTKQTLLQIDREFSELSLEKGAVYAFHHYLADDGLVLPFSAPPRSKQDYASMLELAQHASNGDILQWSPEFVDLARSGDLGYTWGRYTFTSRDSATVTRGFYVTIWKMQKDGRWKFVFDAGNQIADS